MRRAVPALFLVALVLTSCSSFPTGAHWVGAGDRVVQVRIDPATGSDFGFGMAVVEGARRWSDASPFITFEVALGSCAQGAGVPNCIDVYRAPMNGAVTGVGWGSDLHIFGRGATMTFDSALWDMAVLLNAVCHEFGHAMGLDHGDVPGPCQDGQPTIVDLYWISLAYDHVDA